MGSVLDAVVQLVLTFVWVYFTRDTDYITIALIVFSALTVVNAVMRLVANAVKKKCRKTLRQNVKNVISKHRFVNGISSDMMKATRGVSVMSAPPSRFNPNS